MRPIVLLVIKTYYHAIAHKDCAVLVQEGAGYWNKIKSREIFLLFSPRGNLLVLTQ
jgi:hypothetical protein